MIKFATILALGGFVAFATGAAAPVLAKTPRSTPLYSNTVVMHFSGPNGKSRTITEQVYMDAGHDCASFNGAAIERYKHPELAGMKLTSTTCRDSAGGARPGGPAVIVLKFVSADGKKLLTTVVEHQGATDYDMKTCPSVLHQTQAALVDQVKGQFPGGKFAVATCMARPKYVNSFVSSSNQ